MTRNYANFSNVRASFDFYRFYRLCTGNEFRRFEFMKRYDVNIVYVAGSVAFLAFSRTRLILTRLISGIRLMEVDQLLLVVLEKF